MAQYAFNYNDIYDDYLVQATPERTAAPKKSIEEMPASVQPELHKVRRTKQQVIRDNQRKFKIGLAKVSVILAAFIAVIGMAVISFGELNSAKQQLESVNAAYQASLEENNQLKLQLDKALEKVDIDKIAKNQLGLQKIPDKRKRSVDMSQFQQ